MVEWLIFTPLSVLLLMKLYEFVRSMQWALRYGSKYADDLTLAVKRWNKTGFKHNELNKIMNRHQRTWSPSRWPFTGLFMHLPSPLKQVVVNWLFRFPTLMIAQTIIVIFFSNRIILMVGIALLFIGLWVETIHIIINRLTQGYMDNYFSRTVSVQLIPYPDPQPHELNPSRRKLLAEFAKLFAWMLTLVIIGYTGIYTGLSTLLAPDSAFNGLSNGWAVPFDLLYFSIVTLATVGFGDIHPNQDTLIVRMAVASQIMIGFLLVVFLLTSFSLTVEPEEHREDINGIGKASKNH